MPKLYYLTDNWGVMGLCTFPKSIRPKVNVIAQLEFELAYYVVSIQLVSHYATGTPSK